MNRKSWELIKEMEELALKSLPPELYELWNDKIYSHYSERVFLNGIVDPCDTRTPSPSADNRDWTEDLTHENGDYTCKCSTCDNWFRGHKRRITCKVCAVKTSADKLIATAGYFIAFACDDWEICECNNCTLKRAAIEWQKEQ